MLDENYFEIIANTGGYSNNKGILVPGNAFPELSIYPSIFSFYNEAYEMFSKSFVINSWFYNLYIASQLSSFGSEKARIYSNSEYPNADYLRLSIIDMQYTLPTGKVIVTKENYVQQTIFLMEITETGFIQIYPPQSTLKTVAPTPYINNYPTTGLNEKISVDNKHPKAILIINYSLFTVLSFLLVVTAAIAIKYSSYPTFKRYGLPYHLMSIGFFLLGAIYLLLYLKSSSTDKDCVIQTVMYNIFFIGEQMLLLTNLRRFHLSVKKKINYNVKSRVKIVYPIIKDCYKFYLHYSYSLYYNINCFSSQ